MAAAEAADFMLVVLLAAGSLEGRAARTPSATY
jgi:hypothetical protein